MDFLTNLYFCVDRSFNCRILYIILAVIGTGRTVIKYFAKDEGMLSFANNKPVKIFSKGAGSNPDLWGVMVSYLSLSFHINCLFFTYIG